MPPWRVRQLVLTASAALAVLGLGLKSDLLSAQLATALAVALALAGSALAVYVIGSVLPPGEPEAVRADYARPEPHGWRHTLELLGGSATELGSSFNRLMRVPSILGDAVIVPVLVPLAATALARVSGSWAIDVAAWAVGGAVYFACVHLDYLRIARLRKPGHALLQDASAAALLLVVYLAALLSSTPHAGQLVYIGVATGLLSTRVFVRSECGWLRALVYGAAVGGCVAAVGWIMAFLAVPEGAEAGILLLSWYPNQGLIEHTLRGELDRNVVIEYGLFVLVALFLLVKAFNPAFDISIPRP